MVAAAGIERVRAWQPLVPGIVEVFHARFVEHVYPMHAHDNWTLLIVDDGAVRYDLDRHEHGVLGSVVALLPPHVPHNGQSATTDGFRKRVLYLDPAHFAAAIGPAVDAPAFADPLLHHRIRQLHATLARPGDEFEAAGRLALVLDRVRDRMRGTDPPPRRPDPGLAHRLRELLDSRIAEGISLDEAAAALHADPTHLIRAFGREFGMPPHRYLISRRVDLARPLLLDGMAPRDVAATTGFHDQPHLTRHFKRILGTTPGRYARSARRGHAPPGLAPGGPLGFNASK
ncbi:AraC family transcriptional regulator [Nocardia terpenica]|uniref:helix-turn-helix domain-containing protein n=1 Tax=Nocardia terpenica TaxID=455432 RepID=UPI0018959F3B|nr:AraC family transcriptional regulator [Nocardia terpenica]MBF6061096.1 AraC family transcriptional regulator [Nocardia terpenica]MBF6105675.1 AraC family transcriptional regulator [Nocardia terpenica]MBF6112855.1 AraC family transcriptional regulator [Nocardia terpenica]MBF6118985.1 AraC family transcriptional regulator [Nocardia terpenica]